MHQKTCKDSNVEAGTHATQVDCKFFIELEHLSGSSSLVSTCNR